MACFEHCTEEQRSRQALKRLLIVLSDGTATRIGRCSLKAYKRI